MLKRLLPAATSLRPLSHANTLHQTPSRSFGCVGGEPSSRKNAEELEKELCSARAIIEKLNKYHSTLPTHLQTEASIHEREHKIHREEDNRALAAQLSVRRDQLDKEIQEQKYKLVELQRKMQELKSAQTKLTGVPDSDPTETRIIDRKFKP